jgi:alpha-D-xyloside xylohydrolase
MALRSGIVLTGRSREMNRLATCLIALVLCVALGWAVSTQGGTTAVTQDIKDDTGRVISLPRGKLKLTAVSDSVIRVQYTPKEFFSGRDSLVVLEPNGGPATWEDEEGTGNFTLSTGMIRVDVDRGTGALTFKDRNGKVILSEGARSADPARVMGEQVFQVRQEFKFQNGEALYGLGQFQNGYMNYRGRELALVQANTTAVNPFLVSTRGYGILWDNYSKTEFKDGKIKSDGSSIGQFWSQVADGIDYYFIYGPGLDQVVSGYRELTGRAPLFPKWAYGYFQSKERYKSFKELIEVVAEYRRREIPLDTIVLDWQYWGDLGWNPLKFDQSGPFKDPAARIRDVHDLDAHIIISIWPNVTDKSEVHQELADSGYLFKKRPMTIDIFDRSHIYDAYNEKARKIYWKHVKKNIFDMGMDGFWMDATEPETGLTWTPAVSEGSIKRVGTCELGTMARYLNTYSLMATSAVYNGQRRESSDKRVYILTRSAFAGQQRYAATTWSGDIIATWPVYKKQIAAGINFCMAGIPYWTTDIGAFFTNVPGRRTKKHDDPDYRELYVRWFQYGAFCPIFRSHGTNTPREVWRFGDPGDVTYDTLVNFDKLRYRLMPYIYSIAWMVTNDGYTMMRGLAMDFRDDPNVYNINDQFMFGPAFLINAVTAPIKKTKTESRKVYLPECAGWYNFWTGKRSGGGQTIEAYAPLSIIPLYVRAGSIVPMGPFIQYASENSDPIELRIYPGADGRFTLYEDEDDNYNYEKGIYSTIDFRWDDSARTLAIGDRKGSFPGMLKSRSFHVVILRPGNGAGMMPVEKPDKVLSYDGRQLSVGF